MARVTATSRNIMHPQVVDPWGHGAMRGRIILKVEHGDDVLKKVASVGAKAGA